MSKNKKPSIVVIESPYAGNVSLNKSYLEACIRDSLFKGEAPFASHGLYTGGLALNDFNQEERRLGIQAGYAYYDVAEKIVFYTDFGFSQGMQEALYQAKKQGCVIEYRKLPVDELVDDFCELSFVLEEINNEQN